MLYGAEIQVEHTPPYRSRGHTEKGQKDQGAGLYRSGCLYVDVYRSLTAQKIITEIDKCDFMTLKIHSKQWEKSLPAVHLKGD